MAIIERELRIKDAFSNIFDRYIQKTESSIAVQEKAANSLEELEQKAESTRKIYQQLASDLLSGDRSLKVTLNDVNAAKEAYEEAASSVDKFKSAQAAAERQKITMADRIEYVKDSLREAASGAKNFASNVKNLSSNLLGLNKANPALDGITKRIRGMVLYMFTARRLLRYMRDAVQYAPDDVAKPIQGLKSSISGLFNGTMVSALAGTQRGFERLNSAFASPAGQKFARGLETISRFIGSILAVALEKAADLVEWLGDHFEIAAAIAAVMATRTAAKFMVMGASFLFAHAQLILIIAALGVAAYGVNTFVKHVTGASITLGDVFDFIGKGIGWLYATGYNAVSDGWNIVASFVEFFGNVWNDPVSAVGHLFFDLGDTIVGIVESAAKAIDGLLGTDYSAAVTGFRDKIQAFADDTFGVKAFTVSRLDKLDTASIMDSFGGKGRDLANSLSDFNLQNTVAQELKNISTNTSSIAKAVTEEDLKAIIDLAERQFVSNVNLTSQTPVINITGANTGNTAADRKSLADALAKVLTEMAASSGTMGGVGYSEG